jgi:hypothetical protein
VAWDLEEARPWRRLAPGYGDAAAAGDDAAGAGIRVARFGQNG